MLYLILPTPFRHSPPFFPPPPPPPGSECYTRHCSSLVPFSPMNARMGFPNFISVLALNIHVSDLLPAGAITLFCEVELAPNLTLISAAQRHVITSSQLASIGLLGKMMDDTLFSDATLVSTVDGKEHKAHKAVLASCSPVFKAMFENETQVWTVLTADMYM